MAREQALTAILRITKSMNEPGKRGTLKRLFKSHFEHRGMDSPPTAQVDNAKQCVKIYGDVTEEELVEFGKKVNIPFTIDPVEKQEEKKKKEKSPNGLQSQNINLQNKVSKLQGELNRMTSNYKELQLQHGRLDSEVTEVLEKNIELEEQAAKLTEEVAKKSVAISDLSTEKVELEKRLVDLERYAKFPKNFHGAAMAALSEFAEKLGYFDSITGEAVYDTSPSRTTEYLLTRINSLGLAETAESAEDVLGMVKKYITDENAEENLGDVFDVLDKKRSVQYANAVKGLGTIEKQKEKISSELPEDVIEEMKKVLDKKAAEEKKIIDSYNEDMQTFIVHVQKVLSEVSDEISKKTEISNLRSEIDRKLEEKELPVYICLNEDESNYVIKAYFPVKKEQASKSYDAVLCENVLSEKVSSLIRKDDFEKIEEKADEDYGLVFHEIILPKSKYSLNDLMRIKHALEDSVREGYENTAFRKLGVGLNFMFNDRVGIYSAVAGEKAEDVPKENEVAKRREAIKDILAKRGKSERSDIQNALRVRGFTFTKDMILYDLKCLRNENDIEMIRQGRDRHYLLLERKIEEEESEVQKSEPEQVVQKEPADLAEKYGNHSEEVYEKLQRVERIINEAEEPIKISEISIILVQEGEYTSRETLKSHLKTLKEQGVIEQVGIKSGAKYIPAKTEESAEDAQNGFSSIDEAVKAGYLTSRMVAEELGVTEGRVAQMLTHPTYKKKELKSEKIMVGGKERRLVEKESFENYKKKIDKGGD